MKPNFALDLSFDRIGLSHRAKDGWRHLGEVSLDDDDMAAKLGDLRRRAAETADGQLATKLVIPNSQILFRDVEAPGDTPGARRVAIRAALDGTTPYTLDDLVFDWSDAGDGMAKVAVVAAETLREAEDFAAEHHFNPVAFVARPEDGDFDGEPWFGTTRLAKGMLTNGETVERDDTPAAGEPAAKESKPDAAAIRAEAEATLDEMLNEDAGLVAFLDNAATLSGSVAAVKAAEAKQKAAPASENDADATATADEKPEPDAAAEPYQANDISKTNEAEQQAAPDPVGDEADKAPEKAASAAVPAFSTSRVMTDAAPEETAPVRLEQVVARIGIQADHDPEDEPGDLPPLGKANGNAEVTHLSVIAPRIAGDEVKPKAANALAADTLSTAKPILPPPAEAKPPLSQAKPPAWARTEELTVFGARKSASGGAKSRYLGLVLTVALIVAIAAAALISDMILGEDSALRRLFRPEAAPVAVATAPETAPAPASQVAAQTSPGTAPDTEPQQATAQTDPASPVEATGSEDRTEIWPRGPDTPDGPATDTTDDLYVASIDPVIVGHDAVALPTGDAALSDDALAAVPSPAPLGTRFELDERGLVKAVPDGALTPDGIMVIAGRPAKVPQPRPGDAAMPIGTDPETATLAAFRPRTRPEGLVEANEKSRLGGRTMVQLAGIRPAARPPSAQDNDAVTRKPPTEFAVLVSPSPEARPSGFRKIVEKAVAEAQADAPAQDTTAVATAAAIPAPQIPRTASPANVARQATVKNAINLGKINLIGVYGSSSNRRALVRLSSGRYVKVKVGDRIDGGQVAAIGSSQVLYVKNGRRVTLAMPNG